MKPRDRFEEFVRDQLSVYVSEASKCPSWGPRPTPFYEACSRCGARANESCPRITTASLQFAEGIRTEADALFREEDQSNAM